MDLAIEPPPRPYAELHARCAALETEVRQLWTQLLRKDQAQAAVANALTLRVRELEQKAQRENLE